MAWWGSALAMAEVALHEHDCWVRAPPRPLALKPSIWRMQVDVWAVGVLAYELVVGEAPFYHQDEKETVRLIKEVGREF